ncbi:MAG: DUF4349 domain-containing protein [Bacteroidia bacterium]|nr:DUF4349 domain-containing protein [Bacteroidia bacterium]
MKQIIITFIITLFVLSCGSKSSVNMYDSASVALEAEDMTKSAENISDDIKKTEVVKKKIIKDGRLGIEVKNLKAAKTNIDTLIRSLGGYYDNESLINNDYSTEYNLRIRIPSNNMELLIRKIEKGEGEVSYKEITARDVTEEFIDLETRLTNKQKYLAQYQELLKNAKSIKEILDIQEKIRVLEEEIESSTGRLKYLNDQVNYSTLELNISQPKPYKYTPQYRGSFFEKVKQSVIRGWYGFVDFFLFLLSNWAVLILFAVIIYFWVKYRRKLKLKRNEQAKK